MLLTLITVCISVLSYSQFTNVNPDPNGEPWIVGDVPPMTPEFEVELESVPNAVLWEGAANYTFTGEIDNSTHSWFPEIDEQGNYGYCAQAAGIYYSFTYEINRLRGIPSTSNSTIYEPYFTWNMLNKGGNNGSHIKHGLDIVINNGCATKETFQVDKTEITKWMNGYDNYYTSMQNRIDFYEKTSFSCFFKTQILISPASMLTFMMMPH